MLLQPDSSQLTDTEIIDLVLKGNKNLFELLIYRHKSKIATTIIAMIGKVEEVEDIGQEVFIRFYKSLSQFKGESTVGTYLTRIAINLCINELQRRKKVGWRFFSIDSFKSTEIDGGRFYDSSSISDTKEFVNELLSKLNPAIRSVLVMRLINGYSVKETAEVLNIPQGTVLSRQSRGQDQLKEMLTKYRNYYEK